ncbi:permease prefix domain 1-containing protein [Acetivibrio straminisolvens]|jgi:hypothetical protein|uniref:permease prefix domain 1-containing protein n=1 Tax=Acetivibrio straminisolvens TaxID=253314 RepID=UPI00223F8308|nr:permease prefix domain 1-containing protein [Acetivibrio straminisolvens]
MHQFDEYINTIIKDLKISKKKKDEIAEEFLDHLQMLKKEYLSKGMSEIDAVKQAMITFGEENRLKRELSKSLLSYKSFHNIIGGVIIFLIVFIIGKYISVPVYGPKYWDLPISSILFYTLIPNDIIFIALGYYLPIFSKRMERIRNIILVATVIGVLRRGLMLLLFPTPWNGLELYMKLIILISPLSIVSHVIGYVFGFVLLQLFHRTSEVCKRLVLKIF